jgi:hypothetical protein
MSDQSEGAREKAPGYDRALDQALYHSAGLDEIRAIIAEDLQKHEDAQTWREFIKEHHWHGGQQKSNQRPRKAPPQNTNKNGGTS